MACLVDDVVFLVVGGYGCVGCGGFLWWELVGGVSGCVWRFAGGAAVGGG